MMSSGRETPVSRSLACSVTQERPRLVIVPQLVFGLIPGAGIRARSVCSSWLASRPES